ncbi:hypothetical protein FA10DRAFT_266856 [Acaromyces ingoldii]|uniref:K Homology domain-containing protein n=1 Tax=Acaromyces ingoldii TaxID=215250 RepID=A0A316YMI7_9BASI|nr:hypothetical protein FA10DRAFT_266856 [Acaromyces ingoldii]PWN90372.1 hypothetical protein FA10DRAFT_266856 [Acaromyces ingoldii]
MVSAAELQALHQQQQQQQQQGSSAGPTSDPFPSLGGDPFPAPVSSGDPFPATIGSSAAVAPKAKVSSGVNGSSQPDFSSQSAFPSLGASVPAAKGQWSKKLSEGASNGAAGRAAAAPGSASNWSGSAPVIQRAIHQEVFSLPASDELQSRLSQIMGRVQTKHRSVKIEASTTRKTATTTFVVKGPNEAAVKSARKELTVGLARNVSLTVMIPSSLRAFVIGAKGKNLKNITEQTGVRINIPRQEGAADAETNGHAKAHPHGETDYDNDEQISVTIDGDEVNAREAASMISALVAERTSRTTQRLTHIEHIFYPFIAGAKGANSTRLETEVGQGDVSVRIPPRAAFLPPREEEEKGEAKRERDLSIIVSGDRDLVARVVQAIDAEVDEMKSSFRTLQISIPKRQHRFLVGDAAQEILGATSCSVELAAIDDPSDSVTIRGPQAKLPLALTAAMDKANAVRVEVVDVVAPHRSSGANALDHAKLLLRWINLSGKLPKAPQVQIYLPRPAIVESTGLAQIEIVGADASAVAGARAQLDALIKSIPPSFVQTMDIDPLLHRLIIGKKGANLQQYAKKGVDVIFPPAPTGDAAGEGRSDVALILSDPSVINALPKEKKARDAEATKILDEVRTDIEKAGVQAADMRTETLKVPAKLHRAILGTGGTTLNAIIGEERLVAVRLGSSSNKGPAMDEDSITVRGPSNEVERVANELRKVALDAEQDAIVNGHTVQFMLDSAHIPHIVGRGGSGASKLREELGVRIDFGDQATEGAKKPSKVNVVIVGRKENAEEAQKRILNQAEKLADETQVTLKVPANLHGSIIGQGGKYVTRLQDNYGVRINFPSQSANGEAKQKADEVILKGGKKGVEAAKAELLELIEYEKEHNNVVLVPVSTKSIARIMGKGGANVNRIRDETEAQVDVDKESEGAETTTIKLRGTKKAIAAAKAEILAVAAEVDAEASFTLTIPAKFHAQLIGPQGSNLRDIITRAGGPEDGRSATQLVQFPRRGDASNDTVTVRGPSALASKVKQELETAANELSSRIVIGVVVAQSSQRSLMGRIRELQASSNARIVVPGWREYNELEISNASELSNAAPSTIVKIQGKKDVCEALAREISEAFASNSKTIEVPRAVAAKLGTPLLFRQLRTEMGVSVDAPKSSGASKANGAGSRPSVLADSARIDAAEDDDEALPFELSKIEALNDEGADNVKWVLTAKTESALDEAAKHIADEIAKYGQMTHEGRLFVDPSAVPRIVGRGGQGLRDHENASGASIEIPRDGNGLVVITGTEKAVLDARQRIQKVAQGGGRRD